VCCALCDLQDVAFIQRKDDSAHDDLQVGHHILVRYSYRWHRYCRSRRRRHLFKSPVRPRQRAKRLRTACASQDRQFLINTCREQHMLRRVSGQSRHAGMAVVVQLPSTKQR
jgi:hypothetical protein